MTLKLIAVAVLAATGTLAAVPAGATVGSSTLATVRGCSAVTAADACDGTGPGQLIIDRLYGGGVGVGGLTSFTYGSPANAAWSQVRFDGALDLPEIRAFTRATDDVRMNINSFAFQTYTWTGADPGLFSLTGSLHIVDSSTSPAGGALPGGAIYTQYVGIWDPSVIAGLSTPQELFSALFFQDCGAGILGTGFASGTLTGGEATYTATTSECSAGSLILTPGQQVLVVAGLQLPVNRGGFADSTSTFVTRLADDLTVEQQSVIRESITSAISTGEVVAGVPEPTTWALLIAGFGMTGFAMRRRRFALDA